MRRDEVHVDGWLKDVAPSTGLRQWFGHDPAKWEEFRRRYFAELEEHPQAWLPIVAAAAKGDVTLLYSSRDRDHNNAVGSATTCTRSGGARAPSECSDARRVEGWGATGMSHQQRVSVRDVDRAGYQAVLALEKHVRDSGLDHRLYELVKIRASQLNGCAFCLDMHNRDARTAGEDQRRLDVLSAWREAPTLFSDRERAALAFTEAVTRIGDVGVPDPVWADVVESFGERDAVHLLLAVAVINVWNRFSVATRQALPDR